jgi:hypothetical protein
MNALLSSYLPIVLFIAVAAVGRAARARVEKTLRGKRDPPGHGD